MVESSFSPKRNRRRMMSFELLLLLLFSVKFFDLVPLAPVFGGNNCLTYYLLLLAFMYIKYLGFEFKPGIKRHMKILGWFVVGILLSTLSAYLYYGQHFYESFVTYRRFFCLLTLPLFLSVNPTVPEIRRAFYAFCVIFAAATFLVTFAFPGWVVLPDGNLFIEEGEFVHSLAGERYVMVAFIFAIDNFRNRRRRKYMWTALLVFLLLFIIQNRTTLIASMIVIVMAVLINKSARTRVMAEGLMLLFALMLGVLASGYIQALYLETVDQINNPEYNRIKSLIYIFTEERPFLSHLLGTGYISGNVNPIIFQLQERGIFHSDVGLIGMWHQFGFVTVGAVLVAVFRGLSPKHSFLVRSYSMFLLVGSLTLSYFLSLHCILWLCLFLYLIATDQEYVRAREQEAWQGRQRVLRRYRTQTG